FLRAFPSVLRFRLYQTLSCPIPGRSGLRFPGYRFRVSLSSDSNLTRLFFVPVSGPNLIPVAVEVAFAFRRIRLYQRRFGRANRLHDPDKGIDGSSGIQFPVSKMKTTR
ncbi:hypothetical protein ACFRCW_37565, partial [Streptomyces sp. NPDC056653]|uniref:hypothetical protein n=1 Tax=Streptomyces sp. NPDC056653 TaxID=3345894 RepID=UPI0036CD6EAE